MNSQSTKTVHTGSPRLFYFNVNDWTWWVWTATTIMLVAGVCGYPQGFLAAIVTTAVQTIFVIVQKRSLIAFPVQLRLAYLALLLICSIPGMGWLFWWPTLGTAALIFLLLPPRSCPFATPMEQRRKRLLDGQDQADVLFRSEPGPSNNSPRRDQLCGWVVHDRGAGAAADEIIERMQGVTHSSSELTRREPTLSLNLSFFVLSVWPSPEWSGNQHGEWNPSPRG